MISSGCVAFQMLRPPNVLKNSMLESVKALVGTDRWAVRPVAPFLVAVRVAPGGRALPFENVQTRGTTEAPTESKLICEVVRLGLALGSVRQPFESVTRCSPTTPLQPLVQESSRGRLRLC
jgi:hypothetical protein